jgi:hypothetical protein
VAALAILAVSLLGRAARATPYDGCMCHGANYLGVLNDPATTRCYDWICGGGEQIFECTTSDWVALGTPCCVNGTDYLGNAIDPDTTYLGYRTCGGGEQLYECTWGGWQALGTPCCVNGSDYLGNYIAPSATYGGYEVCGGGYQVYECTWSGWQATGGQCGGLYGTGACALGSDAHGNYIDPSTTYIGEQVCGGGYRTYACTPSGWQATGAPCGGLRGTGACVGGLDNRGNPVDPDQTFIGERILASDDLTWECTANGWQPVTASPVPPASVLGSMAAFWAGAASFQLVTTQTVSGLAAGGPQIVPTNQGPNGDRWYGFYWAQDPATGYLVVHAMSSDDRGFTWSPAPIVASLAPVGWHLADLGILFDPQAGTAGQWFAMIQCIPNGGSAWNLCSWVSDGSDPLVGFVEKHVPYFPSGYFFQSICGPGKNCPAGVGQEGTPDIFMKQNGGYYFSFHGVTPDLATSVRAIAFTTDFDQGLLTGATAPPSFGIPDGAWLAQVDTNKWTSPPYPAGSFVGPADSSTLIDPASGYAYTALETSSISLGCVYGQLWEGAFVRSPLASGLPLAGGSEPYARNPVFTAPMDRTDGACPAGYLRLFQDPYGGNAVYVHYVIDVNLGGASPIYEWRLYRLELGGGAPLQPDPLAADQRPTAWGTL